ncbi:MAG: long-chain fatty acid--CoA ligase [Promethearchaeota archaeon]
MKEMLWHKHNWPENVRKTIDYPNEPLYTILDKAAKEAGDKTHTIFYTERTFAHVNESANRIANFLHSKGIKKGDRVALFLPNLPHYPPIFFGILKAGAVAVTCNPRYKAPELQHQFKDSGAKMVFCIDHDELTPTCYEAVKGTDVKHVIICSVKPWLPKFKAVIGGLLGRIPKSPYYEEGITIQYDDIMANYPPDPPKVTIKPKEDLALILYTGGTTGVPKGAMLTHHNLYANVLQYSEWIWLDTDEGGPLVPVDIGNEVYIGALPWYHSFGLTLTMIASVLHQSKLVCITDPRAGKPPFSDVLKAIQDYKVTLLHAVPAMYAALAYHPNVAKYDLSSLKACGAGAAALVPATAKVFEAETGATLFEGYGLTETSPLASADPSNKRQRKFGSVGFPMPDTIIKIVDVDTGKKEMKTGDDGEVAIHGPQVMKGYWNKPKETTAVMQTIGGKQYFLSGDIGHFDKEGYLVITDRKKDMINVSGLKAWPAEIEEILTEHPKIQMAAVIGIPREDDPSNETVKAYVVLAPGQTATEEEIMTWAKDKMAAYKRPRAVEFRDALPQSAVGKVLRRILRDEELAKLGEKWEPSG